MHGQHAHQDKFHHRRFQFKQQIAVQQNGNPGQNEQQAHIHQNKGIHPAVTKPQIGQLRQAKGHGHRQTDHHAVKIFGHQKYQQGDETDGKLFDNLISIIHLSADDSFPEDIICNSKTLVTNGKLVLYSKN